MRSKRIRTRKKQRRRYVTFAGRLGGNTRLKTHLGVSLFAIALEAMGVPIFVTQSLRKYCLS
jgi:hypothetical protein